MVLLPEDRDAAQGVDLAPLLGIFEEFVFRQHAHVTDPGTERRAEACRGKHQRVTLGHMVGRDQQRLPAANRTNQPIARGEPHDRPDLGGEHPVHQLRAYPILLVIEVMRVYGFGPGELYIHVSYGTVG